MIFMWQSAYNAVRISKSVIQLRLKQCVSSPTFHDELSENSGVANTKLASTNSWAYREPHLKMQESEVV